MSTEMPDGLGIRSIVNRDGVALILTAHQRWRREAMSTMLSGRDTIWT